MLSVWPLAFSTSMASRNPKWPRSYGRSKGGGVLGGGGRGAVLWLGPPPALFRAPPSNAFSSMVAQEYLEFFQFEGQTLDQALRYGGAGGGWMDMGGGWMDMGGGWGGGWMGDGWGGEYRPPWVPPVRLMGSKGGGVRGGGFGVGGGSLGAAGVMGGGCVGFGGQGGGCGCFGVVGCSLERLGVGGLSIHPPPKPLSVPTDSMLSVCPPQTPTHVPTPPSAPPWTPSCPPDPHLSIHPSPASCPSL